MTTTPPLRLVAEQTATPSVERPTDTDPMVRLTAEASSPDLDALAALDAYLARFGIMCGVAGNDTQTRTAIEQRRKRAHG
jgi:hypothetical protein